MFSLLLRVITSHLSAPLTDVFHSTIIEVHTADIRRNVGLNIKWESGLTYVQTIVRMDELRLACLQKRYPKKILHM